jgi:hypothetical protein
MACTLDDGTLYPHLLFSRLWFAIRRHSLTVGLKHLLSVCTTLLDATTLVVVEEEVLAITMLAKQVSQTGLSSRSLEQVSQRD